MIGRSGERGSGISMLAARHDDDDDDDKQGGIKYHFLSLWYDLTWDWTTVSQAIGKDYFP